MMEKPVLLMHHVITVIKYGKLFKPQKRRKNLSIACVCINAGNMPFSFSGLMGHSSCKNDSKNLSWKGVWDKKVLERQNFIGWL